MAWFGLWFLKGCRLQMRVPLADARLHLAEGWAHVSGSSRLPPPVAGTSEICTSLQTKTTKADTIQTDDEKPCLHIKCCLLSCLRYGNQASAWDVHRKVAEVIRQPCIFVGFHVPANSCKQSLRTPELSLDRSRILQYASAHFEQDHDLRCCRQQRCSPPQT